MAVVEKMETGGWNLGLTNAIEASALLNAYHSPAGLPDRLTREQVDSHEFDPDGRKILAAIGTLTILQDVLPDDDLEGYVAWLSDDTKFFANGLAFAAGYKDAAQGFVSERERKALQELDFVIESALAGGLSLYIQE